MDRLTLHTVDWVVVGVYLVMAACVGLFVRKAASEDRTSYFLAGRTLPWWWAGLSIAATTFAADTPLAVTGIVASRGLSGNWMWLSWIGVHAAVVVYFAARWSRSGVLTDAELVALRYSGRAAGVLRASRSVLFGLVYNAIILGWVLRAMVKIVTPFFHWDVWTPGLVAAFAVVWPDGAALGTPSEGLTILALLAIVGFYSSVGGIRGVVFTDLIQLGVAMFGSIWLAVAAWTRAGGRARISEKLSQLYGAEQDFITFIPSGDVTWVDGLGFGAFLFGAYLFVQSYTNVPADGGGYMMQRLNATRSEDDARRASVLFVVVHYLVRAVPWFVVAVSALVLVPIGGETSALDGLAAPVADDRELAYPVLMVALLPPVALGLMVTSLLAAFMSTVDTHINWGASYVVNDVLCVARPDVSTRVQLLVARSAVLVFAIVAAVVSLHIDTIEEAWKWVAALGAALGIPTALRWVWWRVTALAELLAMGVGLAVAALTLDVTYELRLVIISASSLVGLVIGLVVRPAQNDDALARFIARVRPLGFWPDRTAATAFAQLSEVALRWVGVTGGVVAALFGLKRLIFDTTDLVTVVLLAAGAAALAWGARRPRADRVESCDTP